MIALNLVCKLFLFIAITFCLNGFDSRAAASKLATEKTNQQLINQQAVNQDATNKDIINKDTITNVTNKNEVLDPEQFSGQIAAGYQAAKNAKEVCAKLFCYCGCDLTDDHVSLLDCFTGMHGVDCAICQEEAIIASNMKKQKKSLAQIQETIDDRFAAQYPWEEASPV